MDSGSIEELWGDFLLEGDNIDLLNSILCTVDESRQEVQPSKHEVLKMFRMMRPAEVKVVIVGQSPYEDDRACGIPFVSKSRDVPKTLEVIKNEIEEMYDCRIKDPNRMIFRWIEQGVFLLNSSLTVGVGKDCPKYLKDHTDLWQQFIARVLEHVCKKRTPVILMGSVAWRYSSFVASPALKVPHPVARGDKKFSAADCFAKIDFIDWR